MIKQLFNGVLKKPLGIFGLLLFSFIGAQAYILHELGIRWPEAFIDASIGQSILGFIGIATIILFRFYQANESNINFRITYTIAVGFIYYWLCSWCLQKAFEEKSTYLLFIKASMQVRTIFTVMVTGVLTIITWLWNNLLEQKLQAQNRNALEQLAINAELEKLRQQLQPHFLFNSLNSISALAGSQPEAARKMIQQLSDFLRGTMKKDEQKLVTFQDELQHLQLYLEIEKVRFGHRLKLNLQHSESTNTKALPPLVLQPLVENAIKFGLYGTIDDVEISISAHMHHDMLSIIVQNPYDTTTAIPQHGTGFGLNSIQRRLFLLYARNDLMHIEKKEKHFSVTLNIPQTHID